MVLVVPVLPAVPALVPVVPVVPAVPLCAPADVPPAPAAPALPVCASATVTAHDRIKIERIVSFVRMLPSWRLVTFVLPPDDPAAQTRLTLNVR